LNSKQPVVWFVLASSFNLILREKANLGALNPAIKLLRAVQFWQTSASMQIAIFDWQANPISIRLVLAGNVAENSMRAVPFS